MIVQHDPLTLSSESELFASEGRITFEPDLAPSDT